VLLRGGEIKTGGIFFFSFPRRYKTSADMLNVFKVTFRRPSRPGTSVVTIVGFSADKLYRKRTNN